MAQDTKSTSRNIFKLKPNSLMRLASSTKENDTLSFFFSPSGFDITKDIGAGFESQKIPGVNFVLYWWTGGITHKIKFKTFLSNLPHTLTDKSTFLREAMVAAEGGDYDFHDDVVTLDASRATPSKPITGPKKANIFQDPAFYINYGVPLPASPANQIIADVRRYGHLAGNLLALYNVFYSNVGKQIRNSPEALPDLAPKPEELTAGNQVRLSLTGNKSVTDVVRQVQEAEGQYPAAGKILTRDDLLTKKFIDQMIDWQGRPYDPSKGINDDLAVLDKMVATSNTTFTKPSMVDLLLIRDTSNEQATFLKYRGYVTDLRFSNWKFSPQGMPTYVEVEVEFTVLSYLANNTTGFAVKRIKVKT